MIFRGISHNRTADAVTVQIEELILDGVLRPGDRLPPERDLSRSLDVSRPILRESLAELERRGLLVARHGGGTFVADVIGEVFRAPVVELVRKHPRAQADYLEFRREVDAIAAGFAAERATEADLALLGQIMDALTEAHAEADPANEARLDVEFHRAISECAHNTVLLHTLRACYRLMADGVFYNRGMLYGYGDCRAALYEQHRAIHDAIVGRDPAAARAAAVAHVDYVAAAIAERQRAGARAEVAERRLAVAAARLDDGQAGRRAPAVGQERRPRTAAAGRGRDA